MAVKNIEGAFEEEIRDLYDAEKQLVKALPKMAKAAASPQLRTAFEEHLEVTKGHVNRLEEVFQYINVQPRGKTCVAMKGLVAEGEEAVEEDAEAELHDILLIGAAKRVEHYEMAAYQLASQMADCMGNEPAAELLRQTLSEEEEADETLGSLCEELLQGFSSQDGSERAGQHKEAKGTAQAPKTRRAGG